MNTQRDHIQKILLLTVVFTFAAYFRLIGLNWDEGAGLHPDERFLNMTQGAIAWGIPWSLYFDTAHSPMNPLNRGTNFYVYGTLPLFIVKWLMELLRPWHIESLHMIGRWVSVICDLITVAAVAALAWSIRGFAAALIAAALASTCVGLVQQAHFGTVDSMATCFSTLSMLALVRIMRVPLNRRLRFGLWCGGAGVFAGAAAATKAPCGLVLALLAPALLMRSRSLVSVAIGGVLAASAAFLIFRVTHPYAFAGPGFWDLALSERWLANLQEQLRLAKPSLGYPPAVQWVDCSPLFSLSNMFHWGVGELPALLIGAALTIGIAGAIRRRDWSYVLIAGWGVLSFVYLALISPNRYLRYQLPAYPMFFVLAGSFATHMVTQASRSSRKYTQMLVAIVLSYSLLWCFAFTRIYTRETPRIAASRWIFKNIPAAVNLETTVNNAGAILPLQLPANLILGPEISVRLSVTTSAEVYAAGLRFDFTAQQIPAQGFVSVAMPGLVPEVISAPGSSRVSFPALVRFEPGRQYPLVVTLRNASHQLELRRPRIVHETPWDDTVPLRIDRFDPFGGMYDGDRTLELFFRDTREKLEKIVSGLDRSDYFFITSQRVWGSVGRLSQFYPLTQGFYRSLLGCADTDTLADCIVRATPEHTSGLLGFRLLRTFESYPAIGPFEIKDHSADESFSVYDHPRVLLFKKDPSYSSEAVRGRLLALIPDPRALPPEP